MRLFADITGMLVIAGIVYFGLLFLFRNVRIKGINETKEGEDDES